MKRLFVIICCLLFQSCSIVEDNDDSAEYLNPIHLNICVLGNSYSNDSFSYLPFILKEYGITCKIHIYYRGSGSLRDLNTQWDDNSPTGVAELDGREHVRLHFSIDTRTDNRWFKEKVMSANDIVSLERWDIISLQQYSNGAKDINTYSPHLNEILIKINDVCSYDYNLAWFMAYNRATDNENEKNINTQKYIIENNAFEIVFPVATAIFSAQELEDFSILGDSCYKKMYFSDNVHLQEGIPCYLAALTIAQSILDLYKPGISVLGNHIRPTNDWIESINSITPNGLSIGVTEENCLIAQRIAIMANLTKYQIFKLN